MADALLNVVRNMPACTQAAKSMPPAFPRALHLLPQVGGMWGFIRMIHRAAHLTIAVSPMTAADLITAGACDQKSVKVPPLLEGCARANGGTWWDRLSDLS